MLNYKEEFERISKTGREVLILKAAGDCECMNPDVLIDSEPDKKCQLCFGTGKHRVLIKTEKIRYELGNSGNLGYLETENYNKNTFENYSFYFPEHYGFLNNDDILIIFDENEKLNIAFEIKNKEMHKNGDFVYYEIFGKKINYLNFEVINERREIE